MDAQFEPPLKIEQAAALMLTVFEKNPGILMTRREVESMVNLEGFSLSTRHGALNYLGTQGHIRQEHQYWVTN